jgi:hypothetical protein
VRAPQPPAEPDTAKAADAKTVSLLPMEIQVGDRLNDHGFEWRRALEMRRQIAREGWWN